MAGARRAELARDVWWNVASLAVAGALGIVVNYLIGVVYGTDALGSFNQVFAVYLVFSQLSALGCHYSVLKHVAATTDPAERRAIVISGLAITAAIGSGFAIVVWLAAAPIGDLVDSAEVERGLRWVAPGVLLFALSKVTLSALNGLGRMRWYAVLFGGRFVAMTIAFVAFAALDVDAGALPAILTIAEAAIFLVSLIAVADQLGWVRADTLRRWVREHLRFGVKGFMSGMLSELNTRVDVLILGYFTTDAVVGAYSFAAILAEGLYQLLVVLRTNFAPVVIRLLATGERDELRTLVRRTRDRTYLGALGAGALAIAGYALLVPMVATDPALAESWTYFAVLIVGMVASAGYAPFLPLLLYGGLPGWHTHLMLSIVVINAGANVALIAAMGALGSAVGTAIAYAASVILLRLLVTRLLQLRI